MGLDAVPLAPNSMSWLFQTPSVISSVSPGWASRLASSMSLALDTMKSVAITGQAVASSKLAAIKALAKLNPRRSNGTEIFRWFFKTNFLKEGRLDWCP